MTMQQGCELLIALAAELYYAWHGPVSDFKYWECRVDIFYAAYNWEVDIKKL